jgi:Na+/proline symporter
MITTADSLLLVAAQMYAIDYAQLPAQPLSEHQKIMRSRWALVGIACAAFVAFMIFKLIQFDVVALVFAIYGAQIALFPAVAAALFLKRYFEPRRAATAAIISVAGGFAGAWVSALYGKFSGDLNWLYNAPVVALAGSSILLMLLSARALHDA